jgi:hypothetical protein
MDQHLKELCIKCEDNSSLAVCLGKYTKPKIKQILDVYGVKMPSAAKKQELADKAEEVIKENVISFFNGEGAAQKKTMQAVISDGMTLTDPSGLSEIQDFLDRGFVYLAADGDAAKVTVPVNIRAIMELVDEKESDSEPYQGFVRKTSFERSEQEAEIIRYAAALANIYGVYPDRQLKEAWDFNHQRAVSPNDIRQAMVKSGDEDGFYINDAYVVSNLLKNVEDYINVLASMRYSDIYYYPSDEVIDEFADGPVYKAAPEYYFLRSYFTAKLGSEEKAEEFLAKLFLICTRDAAEEEVLTFMENEGVKFDSDEDRSRFLYLYTCWFYELRAWSCKGYKPSELRPERLNSRNFRHADGVNPKQIKMTGRNDLCPCGSGKKFKKCCMKYSE